MPSSNWAWAVSGLAVDDYGPGPAGLDTPHFSRIMTPDTRTGARGATVRVASDSYVAHEHPAAGRAGAALCDTTLDGTAFDGTAFAGTALDSAPPPVRPTLSN